MLAKLNSILVLIRHLERLGDLVQSRRSPLVPFIASSKVDAMPRKAKSAFAGGWSQEKADRQALSPESVEALCPNSKQGGPGSYPGKVGQLVPRSIRDLVHAHNAVKGSSAHAARRTSLLKPDIRRGSSVNCNRPLQGIQRLPTIPAA